MAPLPGLARAYASTPVSPSPKPSAATLAGIAPGSTETSQFAWANAWTAGSAGPLRCISRTAASGITTGGPSRCNKSSSPIRASRITGDALTTQSVTKTDLLLEFFEVYREQLDLRLRGRIEEIGVSQSG